MSKEIIFKDKVREKIKEGVSTLANAVKVTLGPKGRNVIIGRGLFYNPVVTKDGVTVARDVELSDPLANIGAQVVKYVASKAADKVGDGTTTSTVLTQAIYEGGLKLIEKGLNPVDIKKGIDLACGKVVEFLEKKAISISLDDDFSRRVSIISANNDEKIGGLIHDAFKIVGEKGAVIVENGSTLDTELKLIEGYQYDRGYINAALFTDASTLLCTVENPKVIITDETINNVKDVEAIFKICDRLRVNNLYIVCEDMSPEVLNVFIANKMNGVMSVCITKAAWIGQSKIDFLQDIAVITGATVISKTNGTSLRTISETQMGECKKVISNRDDTTIVQGGGLPDIIKKRIEQIIEQAEREEDSFDKERLQQRISKLRGQIASIQVGAATEIEQKEISDRVDDAIRATRSAINRGVYVGGGIALINARMALIDAVDNNEISLNDGNKDGFNLVLDACQSPFNTILENAGVDAKEVLDTISYDKMLPWESDDEYLGYNVMTSKIENLFKSGVIDPVEVTVTAVVTACSAASMLLTSECMISDDSKFDPLKIKRPGVGNMI